MRTGTRMSYACLRDSSDDSLDRAWIAASCWASFGSRGPQSTSRPASNKLLACTGKNQPGQGLVCTLWHLQPHYVAVLPRRCPACQAFEPTYQKVAAFFQLEPQPQPQVTVARVDCAKEVRRCHCHLSLMLPGQAALELRWHSCFSATSLPWRHRHSAALRQQLSADSWQAGCCSLFSTAGRMPDLWLSRRACTPAGSWQAADSCCTLSR